MAVSLKSLPPREESLLQSVHVRYMYIFRTFVKTTEATETAVHVNKTTVYFDNSHLIINEIWFLSEDIVHEHEL